MCGGSSIFMGLQIRIVVHGGRYDDVIKWKHFPRYWHFVQRIPGEFLSQRPVGGALMICLICVWINGWVNNHEADDLRRHRGHYDVIVMDLQYNLYYKLDDVSASLMWNRHLIYNENCAKEWGMFCAFAKMRFETSLGELTKGIKPGTDMQYI